GSRVQIGGPTGAFVIIVYGIVQSHGVDGLIVATMMAGALLVALGLARLGGAIKFIPYPVTVGFTSGIAVIIFSGQVGDLLGRRLPDVPADCVGKWTTYAANRHAVDPTTVAVAAGTLAILILWPRFNRRIPPAIVALLASTAAVQLFGLPVETI